MKFTSRKPASLLILAGAACVVWLIGVYWAKENSTEESRLPTQGHLGQGGQAMGDSLIDAAKGLVARAESIGQSGTPLDEAAAAALHRDTRGEVPQWYLGLLRAVPLAGLSFEFGEPDEDGFRSYSLEWNGAAGIRSESLECYPGLAILERGYFNCASDPTGGGDPYFVGPEVDGAWPVYRVYHDVSDQADEIIAHALELVAPSLEALLLGGHCD